LRNFFEKSKKAVIIPTYKDDYQSLINISRDFFSQNKISISQETLSLLVSRCNGDRGFLKLELEKISNYSEQLVGFVIIFIGLWAFYQIFNKKIDTSICTSTVMICLFFIPMLTNIRQTTDIRIPTKIK